jgi:hypothetical protein
MHAKNTSTRVGIADRLCKFVVLLIVWESTLGTEMALSFLRYHHRVLSIITNSNQRPSEGGPGGLPKLPTWIPGDP